jgi:hypothetical protein
MIDEMRSGSVLIKDGSRLPRRLQLETQSLPNGWEMIQRLDGNELSHRLGQIGWDFVPVAGGIRATALGFNQNRAMLRAISRVIARGQLSFFSCLEITDVALHRILGLHSVMVSARPRLIQQGVSMLPSQNIGEWRRGQLARA